MSDRHDQGDLLGRGIASVLRGGTLAAIAAVGIGYLISLASGEEPGQRPLTDVVAAGGGGALIGAGLLVLTLVPVGVLAVAAIGFARHGERRHVAATLMVLALLVASLATAAVVTSRG